MFWKFFFTQPFPQKWMRLFLVLFLFSGASFAEEIDPIAPHDTIEANREKLQAIQEKLEKKQEEVRQLEEEELSVLGKLTKIDQDIAATEEDLAALQSKWNQLQEEREGIEKEIAGLERNIPALEKRSEERVRSFYKASRGGFLRTLFSADSLSSAARRLEFSQAIIAQDIELLEELSDALFRLQSRREQLEVRREELATLFEEVRGVQDLLAKERGERLTWLASIRRQRDFSQRAVRELEQTSKDITALIQEAEAALQHRDSSFEERRGEFRLPALGKVVGTFGWAYEPGLQEPYFRRGIDIAAPQESEVEAIFKGQVIYSGWLDGYGKALIIDHGEGYHTVSAHLSKIFKEVGDSVAEGEVIGWVGDTGSVKGPYLYFELRHQGEPIDPLNWFIPSSPAVEPKIENGESLETPEREGDSS